MWTIPLKNLWVSVYGCHVGQLRISDCLHLNPGPATYKLWEKLLNIIFKMG